MNRISDLIRLSCVQHPHGKIDAMPSFSSYRPGHRGQSPRILAIGCIPTSDEHVLSQQTSRRYAQQCGDVWRLHDGGKLKAH